MEKCFNNETLLKILVCLSREKSVAYVFPVSLSLTDHFCVAVDLLQRTRVTPSRSKGLTSDLSQVAGSAARIQDMLATMLAYIEDVLVSIKTVVGVLLLKPEGRQVHKRPGEQFLYIQ